MRITGKGIRNRARHFRCRVLSEQVLSFLLDDYAPRLIARHVLIDAILELCGDSIKIGPADRLGRASAGCTTGRADVELFGSAARLGVISASRRLSVGHYFSLNRVHDTSSSLGQSAIPLPWAAGFGSQAAQFPSSWPSPVERPPTCLQAHPCQFQSPASRTSRHP